MPTFGEIFKKTLQRRGLTQIETATLLKTTQSVISYYSNLERPPLRGTLLKIAEGLGVSVDELLGQKSIQMTGRLPKSRHEAPHVNAMEALRSRWKKKPQDRDTIRHLVAALFPKNSSEVLAWLEKS